MSQGLYLAVSEILQHLKEQFPPHSQNAKVRSLNCIIQCFPTKALTEEREKKAK